MRLRLQRPRRRQPDDLPPRRWRQRLLIALAAVATTLIVGFAMLRPQLELIRHKQQAAVPKPCAPGQDSGCIGGTMTVIVPARPASASR